MSGHEDPHYCPQCHGQEHHHHSSHPSGPCWHGCGCEVHHRRDDCCCHSDCRDSDDGHGGHGDGPGRGRHGGGGPGGHGRNPNRPTRVTGTSRGRLPSDAGLTPDDIRGTHPADSWAGQRQDLFLPYLFHRANAGDTGARPVIGPFWESPDIHIAPGIAPADAPPVPPELGSVAVAGRTQHRLCPRLELRAVRGTANGRRVLLVRPGVRNRAAKREPHRPEGGVVGRAG